MALSVVAIKSIEESAKVVGKKRTQALPEIVGKKGTQALSEELEKEAKRGISDLVDKNADPDDGTHIITKGLRRSVDNPGQMGQKGQLGNDQNELKDLPIEDGPSDIKVECPSDNLGEPTVDKIIKPGTGAETDMTVPSGDVVENSDLSEFTDIIHPPIDEGDILETIQFPPPELGGIRNLVPRNDGMTVHPTTGVPFSREKFLDPDTGEIKEGSFPEFDSLFETNLQEGLYEASDSAQFAECNKQLQDWVEKNPDKAKEIFTEEQLDVIKNNPTEVKLPDGKTIVVWKNPPGLTWHHNQKPGLMQLVDSKTHAATGHTGGQAIWGNRSKETIKE